MDREQAEHAGLFDVLRVVTSASWLVRDLASAEVLPVVGDLGLDIGMDTDRTAWWCPGMFAARLAASGALVSFVGPTAPWQASFPRKFTGRQIAATDVGALRRDLEGASGYDGGVFAKVADVKLPAVPAAWRENLGMFLRECDDAGVPDSTPVLLTGTFLDLVEEHRCFIAAGQVTAASVYRVGDLTWDAWDSGEQPGSVDAVEFATSVVAALKSQPPGWVLDVGRTREGDWVVVEANPSWCANPYHSDPVGAVVSILAGQDPLGRARQWTWEPGELLAGRAHRRPLQVRREPTGGPTA